MLIRSTVLIRSEETRHIFASHAIGIIEIDANLGFIKANQPVLDALGYTMAELTRRSMFSITHPEDIDAMEDAHRQIIAGDTSVRYQKRFISKTGVRLSCMMDMQCKERDRNGWPVWFRGFISPLSDVILPNDMLTMRDDTLATVYRNIDAAFKMAA